MGINPEKEIGGVFRLKIKGGIFSFEEVFIHQMWFKRIHESMNLITAWLASMYCVVSQLSFIYCDYLATVKAAY